MFLIELLSILSTIYFIIGFIIYIFKRKKYETLTFSEKGLNKLNEEGNLTKIRLILGDKNAIALLRIILCISIVTHWPIEINNQDEIL